jgi:hypothetical protein
VHFENKYFFSFIITFTKKRCPGFLAAAVFFQKKLTNAIIRPLDDD